MSAPVPPRSPRIVGVDWLRGLAMALMLIDHTRDFMHAESFWHRPTDLAVISTATFLTRWITHVCAPWFVFLAGLVRLPRAWVLGLLLLRASAHSAYQVVCLHLPGRSLGTPRLR